MATIYEATSGALIAQPGRSVTTFPSGLIRVDQTYICATVNAATHRATLAVGAAMPDGNTDPGMEALSIHPDPQEVNRGDGFTEFRVSAYGRTREAFSGIQLQQSLQLGTATRYSDPVQYPDIYGYFWAITGFIVIPVGQLLTIEDLVYDSTLNDPLRFMTTPQGVPLEFSKIDDTRYTVEMGYEEQCLVTLGDPTMSINSYINFGEFVEISVSVSRGISTTVITA